MVGPSNSSHTGTTSNEKRSTRFKRFCAARWLFSEVTSFLVSGAVDAGGLLPGSRAILCSFGSSDHNNRVIRAAPTAWDSDSVETPFTASGVEDFNCTRNRTVPFGRGGKMCKR